MKDYSERAGDIVSAVRALRRMGMRVGLPYQTADGVMFFQLDDCALSAKRSFTGPLFACVPPNSHQKRNQQAAMIATTEMTPKIHFSFLRCRSEWSVSLPRTITFQSL